MVIGCKGRTICLTAVIDAVDKLKIHLNIQQERRSFRFNLDKNWFLHLLSESEPGLQLDALTVDCELIQAQGTKILAGSLETTATLSCCRCLEDAVIPIRADFRYILIPESQEEHDREELTADDVDTIFYRDDLLDMEPIIFEQVVLQLPMKPLCREDCQGLCLRCGANLNNDACVCPTEPANTVFSALKDYKIRTS